MKNQKVNIVGLLMLTKTLGTKHAIIRGFNHAANAGVCNVLESESQKKQVAYELETQANELLTIAKKIREAV